MPEKPLSPLDAFPRWTLPRPGHEMRAFARMTAHGPELTVTVDGEPLWSQVFRGVDPITFAGIVEGKRRHYEAEGWE